MASSSDGSRSMPTRSAGAQRRNPDAGPPLVRGRGLPASGMAWKKCLRIRDSVVSAPDQGDRDRRTGQLKPFAGIASRAMSCVCSSARASRIVAWQNLLKTDKAVRVRAAARHAPRRAPGLQARGHLRRGVRDQDRLHVLDLRIEVRVQPTDKQKIMVLGGGPNRIGQGIEFDYCCVHAAMAMRGTATRPSWSTATRRRCRPTTTPRTACTSSRSRWKTCSEIVARRKAGWRDRAVRRPDAAQPRTRPRTLRRADHRHHADASTSPRTAAFPEAAARHRPQTAAKPTARDEEEALRLADGSAIRWWCARATCWAAARWRSCMRRNDLERYMREAVKVSNDSPVLLDRYPERRHRGRRRCLADGTDVVLGGIMEHIDEQAACTRATRPARCRRIRCRTVPGRAAPADRRDGESAQRRWPDERAVRRQGKKRARTSFTCSK